MPIVKSVPIKLSRLEGMSPRSLGLSLRRSEDSGESGGVRVEAKRRMPKSPAAHSNELPTVICSSLMFAARLVAALKRWTPYMSGMSDPLPTAEALPPAPAETRPTIADMTIVIATSELADVEIDSASRGMPIPIWVDDAPALGTGSAGGSVRPGAGNGGTKSIAIPRDRSILIVEINLASKLVASQSRH